MTIYPVTASEFAPYGRVITGYETECEAVVAALSASTPLPEGTDYLAEDPACKTCRNPPRWGLRSLAVCPSRWAGATATTPS